MNSKDKSMGCSGNILVGVVHGLHNEVDAEAFGRDAKSENAAPKGYQKTFRKNRSKKSLWRGPVSVRQSALLTLTAGYLFMVTVLLVINSPSHLLGSFIASEPSLNGFARTYQTAIHFFSFYFLAVLICFCFRNLSVYVAISLMVVYAVVTELAQIPLPNRHSDVSDLLANLTGIGCGIASVWAVARFKSSATKNHIQAGR